MCLKTLMKKKAFVMIIAIDLDLSREHDVDCRGYIKRCVVLLSLICMIEQTEIESRFIVHCRRVHHYK